MHESWVPFHPPPCSYYWITGRVDDVINVSGHRIGTAEASCDRAFCSAWLVPGGMQGWQRQRAPPGHVRRGHDHAQSSSTHNDSVPFPSPQVESALVGHHLCAEAAVVPLEHPIKGTVSAAAAWLLCFWFLVGHGCASLETHQRPALTHGLVLLIRCLIPGSTLPGTAIPFALQAIYAYVTLMKGLGHPPDDPEAVRKELVKAVSINTISQTPSSPGCSTIPRPNNQTRLLCLVRRCARPSAPLPPPMSYTGHPPCPRRGPARSCAAVSCLLCCAVLH